MKTLLTLMLLTSCAWAQNHVTIRDGSGTILLSGYETADPVQVSIAPLSATILSGGTQQFSATVANSLNGAVAWTSSLGTIDALGNFTLTALTDSQAVITAASLADPTKIATATVMVKASGCGTDVTGIPTNNALCGASGSNPYTGEGDATNFGQWCNGACIPINGCNPVLTSGTPASHSKYFLSADLNCGASSLAIAMKKYSDVNLGGHTVTGVVFLNAGLRGFHFFNGTLNCNLASVPAPVATGWAYACVDNENNGGTYVPSPSGGDQIKIHHISGQQGNISAFYMRFTGKVAGAWTEPILVAYNNSFQSIPETTSLRQHAGIYSETQPVEYFNNSGNVGVTGQATATQLLEIYGPGGQDPFPNYVHNNYLKCEVFNVVNGDTCRPILCDGAHYCHLQANDIWPTNNRGTRLRDALNAEVDHNYYHQLVNTNGYTGACWHAGDSDVNSGVGQVLSQSIHHNTCELGANAQGLHLTGQQGTTLEANTFLCAAAGCAGADIAVLSPSTQAFNSVTVDAFAKTFNCLSCSFTRGTSIKPGSVVLFGGFTNSGNNQIYAVTSSTATSITVSDPANRLASETCLSGCRYKGVAQANLFNSIMGAGLPDQVVINGVAGQPAAATLNYCGQSPPAVLGTGGTLTSLGAVCP